MQNKLKLLVVVMLVVVIATATLGIAGQLDRMTQIVREIAAYKAIKPNVLIYSSTVKGYDENVGLIVPEDLQAEWLAFVAKIMDPKIVAMKAELQALVDDIDK